MEIHSKRQFTALCKQHGLVQTTKDDLLKNGRPYHPSDRPSNLTIPKSVTEQVERGARNPALVEQAWRKRQRALEGLHGEARTQTSISTEGGENPASR